MKGVQFAVLTLFWLIGVAMIVAAIQVIPALKQGRVESALIKTNVYMMSSAMDTAESYMKAGLQFSNYQACYELMKNGGNAALTEANKVSFGGTDYGIVPERAAFVESLKNSMQNYLNTYAGNGYKLGYTGGNEYSVTIPKYAVSMTEQSGGVSASATSEGKMSSTSDVRGGNLNPENSNINGKVTITNDASVQGVLQENCMRYYDVMKKDSDEIKASMNTIVQNEIKRMASGISKPKQIDCAGVKDEELAAMKSEINKLSDVTRSVTTLTADLGMTLMTPPETIKDGDIVISYICRFWSTGSYNVEAAVTIPGTERFPVYKGAPDNVISFEPTNLAFAVKATPGQTSTQPSTAVKQLSLADCGSLLSGNYELTSDLTCTDTVKLGPDSSLNVKSGRLTAPTDKNHVVELSGGSLMVSGGEIAGPPGSDTSTVYIMSGSLTMSGGSITSDKFEAVIGDPRISSTADIRMSGGTISTGGPVALMCRGGGCTIAFTGKSFVSAKTHAISADQGRVRRSVGVNVEINPVEQPGNHAQNYYVYWDLGSSKYIPEPIPEQ